MVCDKMRFISQLVLGDAKKSYAQCGEDLIVHFILDVLRIVQPFYLDIGAHHPTRLSNTFLLYEKGCRGVCVEPDPDLCDKIKSKRKRDVCLNVGIGTRDEAEADFYVMSSKTLNTFSKEEAERYQSYENQRIVKVIQIPLISVNHVIEQHLPGCPNFISLDVEGMDQAILETLDFSRFRPEVFCIETLTYAEDKSETKIGEIVHFMVQNNYFVYADTYINTIFVEKEAWNKR
jgi:FkbM family methyltransferase